MNIYGVYCIDNEETCRFIGTMKEIATELGLKENTIRRALSQKKKICRKYNVYKLYFEKRRKKMLVIGFIAGFMAGELTTLVFIALIKGGNSKDE